MSMSTIPVLLYHAVNTEPPAGTDTWTVSPDQFEQHLDVIAESGRLSLTISELAELLRGERQVDREIVVVTFDDGYADTLDAVRTLCQRGLHSTVYVTTGAIGAPRMLSVADVRSLGETDGVEIGAHSVSHSRLDELAAGALEEEIGDSKRELELLLDAPVTTFAYPYGAYDRRTRATVIRVGFRSAAAVKNAISHPHDDPFAIARWTVTSKTGAERVASFLRGEGVPLSWSHERLRTRAYRVVRRARRRLRAPTAGSSRSP
jgi:peptidoglycan/xylan/chitin deacetylase (PgdA/CDA1 family)